MTIHFVYAKGMRTSAPHAITRELTPRLREAGLGEVIVHDLAEPRVITPARDGNDILLGHPHRDPRTVFAASFDQPGWKKQIVLCPFSHAMPELNGWMDPLVERADAFLAITGKYWVDTIDDTAFSHWKYKLRRLDLAVNPRHFPPVKRAWNATGKRRFLYIGFAAPAKGTDYLAAIAEANPEMHFGWIGGAGGGVLPTAALEMHGPCDFHLPECQSLVASYDFVIACGRSDANPTTLLEGLAWGLVPVCTAQSGYRDEPWLVNIPSNNVAGATAVLRRLQDASDAELSAYVSRGRQALAAHFTWDRFADEVIAALREPAVQTPRDPQWAAQAAVNRAMLREGGGA